MKSTSKFHRLFALALFALAAGTGVAQTPPAGGANQKQAAKDNAKKPSAADLQKLVEQLNQKRDTMIADHEALVKQLKDATEEQKKAILEKMEAQKKAFEEATSALHKQIRDEARRQRLNKK